MKWIGRRLMSVLIAILMLAAFDVRLAVKKYAIDAEEIAEPVRIVLVTDLHSCRYGEGQKTLIDAVCAQSPDLVLLGGDIFDDVIGDANTETFLEGIAEKYPCFYVTGNHEYWSGPEAFAQKMAILNRLGIEILSGKCEKLTIDGNRINLCGVEDPDAFGASLDAFERQLEAAGEAKDNGFTILLSHRPEYWETYQKYDFDLVLCGHAHGGQWRIPLVLNGLYAPDQGLLPEYAGGMYEEESITMIVSRGLARESTRVPRIFNRPELVVVDVF